VSALILFLAALTRPEGFLVFAVIAAHNLLFAAIPKSRWMLWFVAFVLPFAVYFFWRYNYYGFLLPNTFYMKVGSTSAQVVRGFKYAASFFLLTVTPLLVLAAPFRKPLSYRIRCAFWIICAYTAYIILVGGDYMTLFRFFVPLLPFVAIVAADVSVSLPFPVFSLFLLLSILPSLNLERLSDGLPLPQRYWNIRQIAYPRVLFERSQVHRLSLLGKWMNENLPATATVAYDGIGAIGWFSNLKIIDMSGLNDIHIAHLPSPEMGHGVAGHEKEDLLYVLSRKPDYILFSRYFLAREELQPDVESLYRERLEKYPEAVRVAILNELRNYELQYVPLTDPWNGESGYMILLKRRQG